MTDIDGQSQSNKDIICPICHKPGFRYVIYKRDNWKIQDLSRKRQKISSVDWGYIIRKDKRAPIYEKKVNGETTYRRRGKIYPYYRYGHYDPELYKDRLARFQTGSLKYKPNGTRWCGIRPCFEISRKFWHEMYQSVPGQNAFYVSQLELAYESWKAYWYIPNSLLSLTDQRVLDEQLKKFSQSVISICDGILLHYEFPVNDSIRDKVKDHRIALTNLQNKSLELIQAVADKEPSRELLTKLINMSKLVMNEAAALFDCISEFIRNYYFRHYKYRKDYGDDISESDIILDVFQRTSPKTRRNLMVLRTKKIDERLEPANEDEAKVFGFSGFQCKKCRSWRLDETYQVLYKRTFKCIMCGSIWTKEEIRPKDCENGKEGQNLSTSDSNSDVFFSILQKRHRYLERLRASIVDLNLGSSSEVVIQRLDALIANSIAAIDLALAVKGNAKKAGQGAFESLTSGIIAIQSKPNSEERRDIYFLGRTFDYMLSILDEMIFKAKQQPDDFQRAKFVQQSLKDLDLIPQAIGPTCKTIEELADWMVEKEFQGLEEMFEAGEQLDWDYVFQKYGNTSVAEQDEQEILFMEGLFDQNPYEKGLTTSFRLLLFCDYYHQAFMTIIRNKPEKFSEYLAGRDGQLNPAWLPRPWNQWHHLIRLNMERKRVLLDPTIKLDPFNMNEYRKELEQTSLQTFAENHGVSVEEASSYFLCRQKFVLSAFEPYSVQEAKGMGFSGLWCTKCRDISSGFRVEAGDGDNIGKYRCCYCDEWKTKENFIDPLPRQA